MFWWAHVIISRISSLWTEIKSRVSFGGETEFQELNCESGRNLCSTFQTFSAGSTRWCPAWKPCSTGGKRQQLKKRATAPPTGTCAVLPSSPKPFSDSTVHRCCSCMILSGYFNYIKRNKRCKCDIYSWATCHLITQNSRIRKGRVLNIVMPTPVFIASFFWLKSPNL